MEENIKNRIILVLAILTVIFFFGTVGSCSNANRQRFAFNKEMGARLDLEEKMNKIMQDKTSIEDKLKEKDKELEEEKVTEEATKKSLAQEKLVTQSLKEELQKVTELKEKLEEDLKDALVTGKSRIHK